MDITPLIPQGTQVIQSYAEGRFRISNIAYDGAVIVMPSETLAWQPQGAFPDMAVNDFSDLTRRAGDLDVVLMGCGRTMPPALPMALKADLKALGIVIEFMDTGAACRTYNVLVAEGRRVAAALLPAQ